ncbi:MAG: hypothetical protein WCE81_10415 [Halobacteriota archaeon]
MNRRGEEEDWDSDDKRHPEALPEVGDAVAEMAGRSPPFSGGMCGMLMDVFLFCSVTRYRSVRFIMTVVSFMIVVIHDLPYIIAPIYSTQCTLLLQSFPCFCRAYPSLCSRIIWITSAFGFAANQY